MGIFGNVPLPAALAWGAMQAPKVGEDVVSLIKSIQGARGEINAAEDYNRLMQIADPRQLQTFQPQGGIDAPTLQKLYANRDARMQQLFANETAPIAAEGSKLLADPEFRGNAEALQEFQSRPAFWTGANDAKPNPAIPQVLQQFAGGAKSQEEQAALGRLAQLKDPSLKGLDPFTLGAITSDKTKVENVQKFSEIAGKEDVKASNAGYLSAVSQLYGTTKTPEELAAGLAQAGAQFPNASKEIMESVQNAVKLKYPEMKFERAFTGDGEYQILKGINPLTGANIDIGGAGIPSAPKVTVTNEIQQETEYSKKRGANLAERENTIINEGDAASKTLMLIGDAEKLSQSAYSGAKASVLPTVNRYTAGYIGDPKKATATVALDRILKELTLSRLKTFGAAPTEGERNFLIEMNGKTSYTKPERDQLIAITKKYASEALGKKQQLVDVNYNPSGPRSEKGLSVGGRPPLSSFRR